MVESIQVLHVDDEPEFLEISADLLVDADDAIEVEMATTASDGLERLGADIDCVITDYEMPGMDGIDFLEAIRESYPNLPVILFTGCGSEEVASEAITAGVTDYLQKKGGSEQYTLLANRVRNAVDAAETQHRLKRQRQEYETLVEASPIPMVVTDEQFTLVYANQSATDAVGLSAGEYTGKSVLELLHPEDRGKGSERAKRVFTDREPVEPREYRVVDTDGQLHHVRGAIVPVTFEGEPAAQIVFTDITERKTYERELERKNERLDTFTSLVSHDLRNPLNIASSRVELAHDECDSEHLEHAIDAHERMESIIEETLELAKQGEIVDELVAVALADHVPKWWETVDADAATLHVEDVSVRADPDRLQHVFQNLFENAIDHAGEDVTVRIGPLTEGFYVEDDGPGIPEEDREEVFEPGVSRAVDGTGFGLAIVREITDAHGWEVQVTDSDDGGARFEVTGVTLVE